MSLHVKNFGTLVLNEMERFGLIDDGWDYTYDRAKKRLGQCDFRNKVLSFSLPYINCNAIENMHNTILHEIAHALVGPGEGHGYVWRMKARTIGAKPQACNDDPAIVKPMGDYMFKCNCTVHYFHRKTRSNRRKCRNCGHVGLIVPTGSYSEPDDKDVYRGNPVVLHRPTTKELLLGAFD